MRRRWRPKGERPLCQAAMQHVYAGTSDRYGPIAFVAVVGVNDSKVRIPEMGAAKPKVRFFRMPALVDRGISGSGFRADQLIRCHSDVNADIAWASSAACLGQISKFRPLGRCPSTPSRRWISVPDALGFPRPRNPVLSPGIRPKSLKLALV